MVRVMGSWAANPATSERLLSFFDAHQVTDALAIAPYFGHEVGNAQGVLDGDLDGFIREWLLAKAAGKVV